MKCASNVKLSQSAAIRTTFCTNYFKNKSKYCDLFNISPFITIAVFVTHRVCTILLYFCVNLDLCLFSKTVFYSHYYITLLFLVEPPSQCKPFEFPCADGGCVYAFQECNGERNCEDGSDEHELCGKHHLLFPSLSHCNFAFFVGRDD